MLIRYVLCFLLSCNLISPAFAAVARPPQFVVLSYDGGINLNRWKELEQFTAKMKQRKKPIHFTIFLSGTNFLTQENNNWYQGPQRPVGEAAIPFGGTQQEVERRIDFINKFYLDGHEMGSHAVGHFDGDLWTINDWQHEFQSFNRLFVNITQNNNLSAQYQFVYPLAEIVGFRAPYLSVNTDLYNTLVNNHFRYDASGIDNPSDWPKKINGLWHFNLVRLTIAGTNKKTISMDYNFYLDQSNAKDDPENQTLYYKQMLNTYSNYFYTNYNGNRAPIRIGHHFSKFQNDVYNQALFAFAEKICGLPDVRCVSFKELADFMDNATPNDLAAYQKAEFYKHH